MARLYLEPGSSENSDRNRILHCSTTLCLEIIALCPALHPMEINEEIVFYEIPSDQQCECFF